MAVSAQNTCIINGTIADNDTKVKKVSLTYTDALGKQTEVATAKVKRGKYTLKHELAQDAPALQYTITGLGEESGIALFVEPGEVAVNTALASKPEQSKVSGTPTNDAYAQYQAILTEAAREVADKVAALEQQHGQAWTASPEGKSAIKRLKAQQTIKTESQVIRFLIDHNASPMTPWVIEHVLLPKLTAAYAEQMTKAVATSLHQHPYYLSLRNSVLASNLKVGNEVPDIALPLLTGDTKQLADFRGRYVILNFWRADSERTPELLTELQSLHELVKANADQLVIISIALENDIEAWKATVESKGIAHEGWLHACDGAGTESPAAKLFGIEQLPQIVLIEPEGRAVSLDMETDELVMRIEQILSGDLYYLDEQK